MHRPFLFAFLFFLTVTSAASASQASREQGETLAVGTSAVVRGNLSQARERALADGLRRGAETYLLGQMDSARMTRHFERIVRDVLPGLREQVDVFHILGETLFEDRLHVLLRIRINDQRFQESLRMAGIRMTEAPQLRMLLMVSEIRNGQTESWWKDADSYPRFTPTDLALHQVFQDRGFELVNRSHGPLRMERIDRSPDPSQLDLLQWAREFQADMVIYGQCRILENREVRLDLRAMRAGYGEVPCKASVKEETDASKEDRKDENHVLRQAATRAGEALIPCLMEAIALDLDRAQSIRFRFSGAGAYEDFLIFKRVVLTNVAGVEAVMPARIQDNTLAGVLEFKGERETFLKEVLSHDKLPFQLQRGRDEEGELLFLSR